MTLTLESVFWVLFITIAVGFWFIERHLKKIMDRFDQTDEEIRYIQTKLGIDKDLMNRVEIAKREY